MAFLRRRAALAGDDEVAGCEAFGFAAATAEERERFDAKFLRFVERGDDVGRVAARGEHHDEIAGLREAGDLAGENVIVAEVVADAGDERAVRREREGRKGTA